jgi:hypothetical protein
VKRETQYREFTEACRSKGLPIPTRKEWSKFSAARDRMPPNYGYMSLMSNFARTLSDDVPLRIEVFAPPTESGLGLLTACLGDRRLGTRVIYGLSVFSPKPKAILVRNRKRLMRPSPVFFEDGDHVCMAGTEGEWVYKNVSRFYAFLAKVLIGRMGLRD